ncbi:DUF2470 domain-containing protein [Thalassospira sp. MA62]|nr:DUF2470 domain-containing protein [Thalassospira sp. MA62]
MSDQAPAPSAPLSTTPSKTSSKTPAPASDAASLRQMVRTAPHAVLATLASDHKQVGDGWPVASMVLPTCDIDGTPLLLISDLADHTRNILADNRVSLLVHPDDRSNTDPKIETDTARLTIFGRAHLLARGDNDHDRVMRRYLAHQPDAATYAGFADFNIYRINVDAVYWVGGFGKQRRLSGDKFIAPDCQALIDGHDGIITHMNADHLDAISDIVDHYSNADGNDGWHMQAIDCDGMDLISTGAESRTLRIEFDRTIENPTDARNILVEMCKKSRTNKA